MSTFLVHVEINSPVRLLVARLELDAYVARVVPGAVELGFARQPWHPASWFHRREAIVVAVEDRAGDRPVAGTLLAVPTAGGGLREDVLHFLFAG
jgi:hypothetical protein